MIILPDRNVPRAKFLMPMHKRDWRTPSRAQTKDFKGNENHSMFRIRARLNDGFVKWVGWFDDREDFDAFLWAINTDTLKYERALWDLPNASWLPDIGENLSYDFATTTFLTTAGSLQSYSTPVDWNNGNNSIECIGGGGGGGAVRRSSGFAAYGAGGGGGGYGKYSNLSISGSISYQNGSGATAVSRSTDGATNGNAGGDTWFNGSSFVLASVGGNGGGGGGSRNASFGANVSGGTAGSFKGTSGYSGGRGGNISSTADANREATGGGGAGGLNAAGNNGGDLSSATNASSNGGQGDGTFGGSAGVAQTSAGGDGTEYQVSPAYGSGGGGGGHQGGASVTGFAGGNYGGAGGGAVGFGGTSVGGAGIQGLIVVTYEPAKVAGFNLPMLGM